MSYISREAAIEAIEKTDWYHINNKGVLVHGANSNYDIPLYIAEDIHKAIEQLPSADVVEVIRCKDCKHYVPDDFNCLQMDTGGWIYKPDGYCSYAERRNDD